MNDKLQTWLAAQEAMQASKQAELDARHELLLDMPCEMGVTKHLFKDDGIELKVTRGITRTLDKEVLSDIMSTLTAMEKAAVVMKPSLDLAIYRKLKPNSTLSKAVIAKPSLPSIKAVLLEE